MVGSPKRKLDLLPSRFIGREGFFEQQGMPFSFKGQSISGRETLPLSGIYAFQRKLPGVDIDRFQWSQKHQDSDAFGRL